MKYHVRCNVMYDVMDNVIRLAYSLQASGPCAVAGLSRGLTRYARRTVHDAGPVYCVGRAVSGVLRRRNP